MIIGTVFSGIYLYMLVMGRVLYLYREMHKKVYIIIIIVREIYIFQVYKSSFVFVPPFSFLLSTLYI